jgi:5-methylcytosine-specific restriction enzyme A
MSTYLLTWNPKRSPNENLDKAVSKLKHGHPVGDWRWSSGNNKHIMVGDRVFLLRQGNDLPGLVGSGWVTKGSFQAPSWEAAKRKRGILAWYVLLEWDEMVLPQDALPRAQLLKGILSGTLLKSASSGVTVEPEFTEKLEQRWAAHRKTPLKLSRIILSGISALEGEPIEHRGYRHKRDQQLRRAALDAAGGICAVCAVDFTKVLAGKGVRVLQVHHKSQLSQQDQPKLNTAADLAVVCANCHALIHLNPKKALTVSALKSLIMKAQS